jgi:hypothetical protein
LLWANKYNHTSGLNRNLIKAKERFYADLKKWKIREKITCNPYTFPATATNFVTIINNNADKVLSSAFLIFESY